MTKDDFQIILEAAIAGKGDALEAIFEIYSGLINKQSTIDGKVDEDLRQSIHIQIALNISKFEI